MKLHKRVDFIKLPENTIYSRVHGSYGELCYGLFCKTSGEEMRPDWYEQDLIDEGLVPDNIVDGLDCEAYILEKRDNHKQFELDYECVGRDGMYEDKDVFVVWGKKDVRKLIDYLEVCEKDAL